MEPSSPTPESSLRRSGQDWSSWIRRFPWSSSPSKDQAVRRLLERRRVRFEVMGKEPLDHANHCRICCDSEDEHEENPVLRLGCSCKGDMSYGHLACLRKWFVKQYRKMSCEICRRPLGGHLKLILGHISIAKILEHGPRCFFLLKIPSHDLDLLHLPVSIPDFGDLLPEARYALEASFDRLSQEQERSQRRRLEDFATVCRTASDLQEQLEEDREALDALASTLRFDFLQLAELNPLLRRRRQLPPGAGRVFVRHNTPRIPSLPANARRRGVECLEGHVIRVPIEDPEGVSHPAVEDLLGDLAMQAGRFLDQFGEDVILLPASCINLCQETEVPRRVPLLQDLNELPMEIPDPRNGAAAVVAAAAEADGVPNRKYTYARLQMFRILA